MKFAFSMKIPLIFYDKDVKIVLALGLKSAKTMM